MFKNMKIGIKILLVILVMSLGTLLIISISSYVYMTRLTDDFQRANITLGLTTSDDSKEALENQAEEYLIKIADKQAIASNEKLEQIRRTVQIAAIYIEEVYKHRDNFQGRSLPTPNQTQNMLPSSKYTLAPGVEDTEEIQANVRLLSNCEYLFAPNLSNNTMLNNMYVGTESGISYRYSNSNLYDKTYDSRKREWYQKAMESPEEAVWLDTYIDSYGHTCITCAKAFKNKEGRVVGVVAADIALRDMLNEITSATIGTTGFAFVLDKDMQYIAHPDFFADNFEKDASLTTNESVKSALTTIIAEKEGIVQMPIKQSDSYIAFATLPETDWKLCVSINKSEVIEPALATKAKIDYITGKTQTLIQSTLSSILVQFIVFFAVVGIIVIMMSFVVAGTITRPIQKLAQSVAVIGDGNFDMTVQIESGDEIGELAQAFNTMLQDLKSYIANLTEVTSEKERISAELQVATQIQANMLPCIFPAFPEREEIDIYATMDPAKEVGGDFYDFFMVDEYHLAVVIADVSGKGVPAALFMVIGKTLIKDRTLPGVPLGQVFTEVNNLLCESNKEGLFITAFEAVLDLRTGELEYVNAGHEMPYIYRKGGKYSAVDITAAFVLAGMEHIQYQSAFMKLEPGDRLFQYTDGVTEATNAEEKLYGMDRLEMILNSHKSEAPEQLLHSISKDIDLFVKDAPQFDDITMLCLEYKKAYIAKDNF